MLLQKRLTVSQVIEVDSRTGSSLKTSLESSPSPSPSTSFTYFPDMPCNIYSASRSSAPSDRCGRPIFVRYLRSSSALDLPEAFFVSFTSSGGGVGRDDTLPGRGGAKDGRNGGFEPACGVDEASECRNWTAACFLDRTG